MTSYTDAWATAKNLDSRMLALGFRVDTGAWRTITNPNLVDSIDNSLQIDDHSGRLDVGTTQQGDMKIALPDDD